VTFNITVKNNTDVAFVLESIIDNIDNDHVSIKSDQLGSSLSPNNLTTLTVKVVYDKELQNNTINLNDASFSLSFKDPTIMVNPLTSSEAVITLLAGSLFLALTVFIFKRKKKPYLLLLLLMLAPAFVIAKDNINIDIKFNDLVINGRYLDYEVVIYNENNEPETIIKTYGTTLDELTTPTKPGYNFENWVDDNNNVVSNETPVTGAMVIKPQFALIEYNITYDLAGGTLTNQNPTKYTVEDEITLINPTWEHHIFV
jgi:hypothetical protein